MAHKFVGPQREWARYAADSANPQMWEGLVSAWLPCLGNRSGQFMFDAGPVHRAAKGPAAPTWEYEPKIGLVSASNFSVYSHINSYVPLPVPELTVVSLFKTQASYGGSNYSVYAARHCYSGGNLGWRVGYWHPSSGVFSFVFECANTGNDSWGTCPQPSTLLAGTWYLAVYRYNGKVKTVDVYKTDGTSASASSTLTNGGAINYYYYSQNDFSFFDITDSTRYGGLLIYGRDIGQRMSQQIGQGGPYGGGILRPFIPRAGKVFPVGSVAASYDVSGSSDLSASLSVIAAAYQHWACRCRHKHAVDDNGSRAGQFLFGQGCNQYARLDQYGQLPRVARRCRYKHDHALRQRRLGSLHGLRGWSLVHPYDGCRSREVGARSRHRRHLDN